MNIGISNCIFEVWTPQKWGFDFISVLYNITDLQAPETL